jgi:hypothetical protein
VSTGSSFTLNEKNFARLKKRKVKEILKQRHKK